MPANIMRMPLSTPLKSTSTSYDISATLRSSSGAIPRPSRLPTAWHPAQTWGETSVYVWVQCWPHGGRIACPHGKSKRRRSIAARSRVSGRHCPQFSQPACLAGRLPGHSFRRRRGSPSTPSGAPIRCARIVSRVRWRREAASRTDGRGNSARRRAECPRHFVSRPRPIEKRPLHAAPASAACADSVSITSAGMSTCGAKARTSAPPGMVHASSLGSSGMRQANRRPCCDDFRHAAAGRRAAASGRTRKSIIACRFIVSGTSIGVCAGRTCSIIWGLPNLQVINRDAHVLKCADEAAIEASSGRRGQGRQHLERPNSLTSDGKLVAGARNSRHHRLPPFVVTIRSK